MRLFEKSRCRARRSDERPGPTLCSPNAEGAWARGDSAGGFGDHTEGARGVEAKSDPREAGLQPGTPAPRPSPARGLPLPALEPLTLTAPPSGQEALGPSGTHAPAGPGARKWHFWKVPRRHSCGWPGTMPKSGALQGLRTRAFRACALAGEWVLLCRAESLCQGGYIWT